MLKSIKKRIHYLLLSSFFGMAFVESENIRRHTQYK